MSLILIIISANISEIIVPLLIMYTKFKQYNCQYNDFETWKQRFAMHFVINIIKIEKRVLILIILLENKAYASLRNIIILKKLITVPYEDIIKTL